MNRLIVLCGWLLVLGLFLLVVFVGFWYSCFKAWAGLPLDFYESERDCSSERFGLLSLSAAIFIVPFTLGTIFLVKGLKK